MRSPTRRSTTDPFNLITAIRFLVFCPTRVHGQTMHTQTFPFLRTEGTHGQMISTLMKLALDPCLTHQEAVLPDQRWILLRECRSQSHAQSKPSQFHRERCPHFNVAPLPLRLGHKLLVRLGCPLPPCTILCMPLGNPATVGVPSVLLERDTRSPLSSWPPLR